MFDLELPDRYRCYVPLAAWLIVAMTLLAIPFKILGLGFLPGDDALRHVAKAVSGKPWPDILVLGDSYKIDQSLGWHAILGAVHHATGWGTEGLLIFSVSILFIIVNWATLPWLKRPEAWLAILTLAMLVTDVPIRFLLGRPFILTCTVLMTLLFMIQRCKPSGKLLAVATVLIAACTYIHGVWYLWLLPIGACAFAGQYGWTALLTGAWLLGTCISMLLSGHPGDYLGHALHMALNGVGGHFTNRTEASELQPANGNIVAVIVFGGVALLRWIRPAAGALPFARNPAFWMVCGCWILGFRVGRFWEDWGWPALLVLLATELDVLLEANFVMDSLRRLWLTLILAAAAFFCMTSDLNSRWTAYLTTQFLNETEHPELHGWMPDKGGILYSADMTLFYQTFYKNPNADWRYQVGFEPALMPAEDFETYHKILWNDGDAKTYAPWVKKMVPADRLVIRGGSADKPKISELEWYYGVSGLWIGRLPQTNAPPVAPVK